MLDVVLEEELDGSIVLLVVLLEELEEGMGPLDVVDGSLLLDVMSMTPIGLGVA